MGSNTKWWWAFPAEEALHDPALRHFLGTHVCCRHTHRCCPLSALAQWGIRVAGLSYYDVIHLFPSVRHLSSNVIDHGKEDNWTHFGALRHTSRGAAPVRGI